MFTVFVAVVFLMIGLCLGLVMGRLTAEAGRDRSKEDLAIEMARALDDGQTVTVSTVVSKCREEEEDKKETWRLN